jgi:hypothetical protein
MPELASEEKKRVALVCTVWGAAFLETFCEHCLASLLAPGNLPWARTAYDITFLIYTRQADIAALQGNKNLQRVAGLVEVKFVPLEDLPAPALTGHWVQWQHAALQTRDFHALVLIIPDCVYANSLLSKVLGALETKDIIYYSLPQVCLELILPRLRELRSRAGEDGSLDLTENEVLELFIDYINPKHAVALVKPEYFVAHPEWLLNAQRGRLDLMERACHPLAVSSRAASLSHTLNPAHTDTARLGFFEVLGVSCESTLKYIEQYFHWRADGMNLSRTVNYATWDFNFLEAGAADYAKTQTEIFLSGADIVSQQQIAVTNPRLIFINTLATFHVALWSLYSMAGNCEREVQQLIALAMQMPGFRKAIMRQRGSLTVMLPLSSSFAAVVSRLYEHGSALCLVDFLLLHVIRGKLALRYNQQFVLDAASGKTDRTGFRAVDASLAADQRESVTGTVMSHPMYLTPDIVVYYATMNYGPADKLIKRQDD